MSAKLGYLLLISYLLVLAIAITSPEITEHVGVSKNGSIVCNSEFSISCNNCTVNGDLSLSGGGSGILFPDSNFTGLPFDFSQDWLGVVVEEFSVYIDLDFVLTPTGPTNEISIPLIGTNGAHFDFNIVDIFDVTWTFNPILHGWINSSSPVNFSYGFEFTTPPKSALWIPVFNLSNITSVGFSQAKLTPLNYTSQDPNDNFEFELSFRPIFEVSGSVLGDTSLQAEVFAEVPKLDIVVSQVADVGSNCQPVATGAASDVVFHNLTYVVPTLSFDIGFNATDISTKLLQIGPNITLPTSCLDYLPSVKELGTVPDKSSQGERLHTDLVGVWIMLGFVAIWFF